MITEKRVKLQVRTYPSISTAFKKVAIDKKIPISHYLEDLICKEVAFTSDTPNRPLNEKHKAKIASKGETMSVRLNFETYEESWKYFVSNCRTEYKTTPTARINALIKREIMEHEHNYMTWEKNINMDDFFKKFPIRDDNGGGKWEGVEAQEKHARYIKRNTKAEAVIYAIWKQGTNDKIRLGIWECKTHGELLEIERELHSQGFDVQSINWEHDGKNAP